MCRQGVRDDKHNGQIKEIPLIIGYAVGLFLSCFFFEAGSTGVACIIFIPTAIAAIKVIIIVSRKAFAPDNAIRWQRFNGGKDFRRIDFFKWCEKRGAEDNQYYQTLIKKINEFYADKGKIDDIIKKEGIKCLFTRRTWLEGQLKTNSNISFGAVAIVLSLISIVLAFGPVVHTNYTTIDYNDTNLTSFTISPISIEIVVILILSLILLLSFLNRTDKHVGKYLSLVNQYEVEVLSEKIREMETGMNNESKANEHNKKENGKSEDNNAEVLVSLAEVKAVLNNYFDNCKELRKPVGIAVQPTEIDKLLTDYFSKKEETQEEKPNEL